MRHTLHFFALFFILLLPGCTDESKLDRLQAILQKQDELHNAATPTTCFLRDIDRDQQICVLGTARPLFVGDIVFVGDDMWRIEAVKLLTAEMPDHLRNPKVPKVYRISGTELLVKFLGKGTTRPPSEPTEDSPQPQ
jgi:hypothetical protein